MLLKGLTAGAADPDPVAFEHAFDIDHVIDRVIDPMIDRAIDRVIELDYVRAIVRRPLVRTIDCFAICFASFCVFFAFRSLRFRSLSETLTNPTA